MEDLLASVLLGYDFCFFLNLYSYHLANGNQPLLFHMLTAASPLLLSITQCWKFVRAQSLMVHRWTGRACVASTLWNICLACLSWHTESLSIFFQTLVNAFAVAWLLSAAMTWYYGSVRDLPRHRDWGIRLASYSHAFPLLSWYASGASAPEPTLNLKSATPESPETR